ncbi:MAG TPA: hypothetical protein VGG14_06570 [Candidatus Sulfotelmatobacter sp.]
MKIARLQRMFLPLLLCGTLVWTACSTSWIGEAEQIVNVLIPAVANVMTLIATLRGNVPAADLQTAQSVESQVNSDLQLLQSLLGQYQKAAPSSQTGLLSQIQAALGAVQSELDELLPALHITDTATQEKVETLVGIVSSEVQSMAAIVPVVKEPESSVTVREAAKPAVEKIPLSASDFVTSYNAAMVRKTGNARLDHEASGLRIHAHGKVARWVSAGLLQ